MPGEQPSPLMLHKPWSVPQANRQNLGLDLTEREYQVLSLMVEGLNNTQIAGRLTVSPSTIKSHVSNILAKLGVSSRTEAVTLALRNGLVS